MQSSTGQYSTQAGEPAHPVQHSVITANSFGFFFRGVNNPLDLGSNLSSSGTIPAGFKESASAGMAGLYPIAQNPPDKQKAFYRRSAPRGPKACPQSRVSVGCAFCFWPFLAPFCSQSLSRFWYICPSE